MEVLNLTLKKKWFDMILSGEKTEEYREIKGYWYNRLNTNKDFKMCMSCDLTISRCPNCGLYGFKTDLSKLPIAFKHFDAIKFTNGYGKDKPNFTIECRDIEIREGKKEWGAEAGVKYFVIKLGKILNK